jgi:transaldolase
MELKLFIDSANPAAIKDMMELGVLDGVTTNPTLVAKENRPFMEVMLEIAKLVEGRPVNIELVTEGVENMVAEAKGFAKLADNFVMKIPISREGLKVVHRLASEGISTNVTLIFSPAQALLSAKAGANYVSPFVGRLDDISHYGMDLVNQIVTIYANYAIETEVIVASIRNPLHVLEAALMGADIATIPPNVVKQLTEHPLTDKGIQLFMDDYQKIPKK